MKKHSTDIVSLAFGLIFLSVAGWWLAGRFLDLRIDVPHLGWIAAATLIGLGLLGVWASLRHTEPQESPAVPLPAPAAPPAHPTDPEPAAQPGAGPADPDRTAAL